MNDSQTRARGKVFLVGAGPGDPGLITARGIDCLRQAEIVFYDYLVNPQLLLHCPPEAERVCLGQHARTGKWSQHAIEAAMVQQAQLGRMVVRLKGGDPIIFGRLSEELQSLRLAGVPYEVVPGITTALAVGSLCEVPLTQREDASALAILTGQEDGTKSTSLDYRSLAEFPGTLAIYMGVTTASHWSHELIAAGKAADTPCLLVRRCSWPSQEIIRCRLDEVAERMTPRQKFPPPVLVLIGNVVSHAPESSWFMQRPLRGHRVLVTRPERQVESLGKLLAEKGAEVFAQPVIEIAPPDSWLHVDRALDELGTYDWIVFSSANGVELFLNRLWQRGDDMRRLGGVRIGVIGSATAQSLSQFSLRADLQPPVFQAESLAEALLPHLAGKRVLLVRASRGRDVLADQLAPVALRVDQVTAYMSRDVTVMDSEIQSAWNHRPFDWITITSSAIARSADRLMGDWLRSSKIASLSPVTSATLRELGYEPTVEATTYTMPGLVEAMLNHLSLQDRQ